MPNAEFGIYLQYIKKDNNQETWLSLSNVRELKTVAACGDELFASVGLFLPRNKHGWRLRNSVKPGKGFEMSSGTILVDRM